MMMRVMLVMTSCGLLTDLTIPPSSTDLTFAEEGIRGAQHGAPTLRFVSIGCKISSRELTVGVCRTNLGGLTMES